MHAHSLTPHEAPQMAKNNLRIVAVNSQNVSDRLILCWGHLDGWATLEVVKRCRRWLEETNTVFTPTTFIAYRGEGPAGMIEFVPQRLLRTVRLCPCRVDEKTGEVESRYVLEQDFDNYLFISCLFVSKNHQGKGVGRTLLNHFLKSDVIGDFEGALVYVTERDESWNRHIHWPAGPKEFYLKAGFVVSRTLKNPAGYILSYRK